MLSEKHTIKLIVGLANPGLKYASTRHNIGGLFIKKIIKQYNIILNNTSFGSINTIKIANNKIKLLIPSSYMNLSGKSVFFYSNLYKIKEEEILIAHDELNLPPGRVKLKFGGRSNGHNGLKSIQNALNSSNFYRLKIGIGHPGNKYKVPSFVLEQPSKTEKKLIDLAIDKSIDCLYILNKKSISESIKFLHSR